MPYQKYEPKKRNFFKAEEDSTVEVTVLDPKIIESGSEDYSDSIAVELNNEQGQLSLPTVLHGIIEDMIADRKLKPGTKLRITNKGYEKNEKSGKKNRYMSFEVEFE
jgi:hypothetical protein